MAERVMLALGPFRFEMGQATYQSLAMSQSWRWPQQARIGGEPALQYTGHEPAEVRLQGVLFPGFDAGLAQVQEMRSLANLAKPLQLVDGLGRVWGAWVIVEVSDTRSVLMDNGQPRRVGFEIKLQAYGEDDPSDYSGSWSPFAMLFSSSSSDDFSNDPLGAIHKLLKGIADLTEVPDSGVLVNLLALAAIQKVLGEVIDAAGRAVRGLHSEWLQAMPDARDPVRQALDTWLVASSATQPGLSTGRAGLKTQVSDFLAAIKTLRAVLLPRSNASMATTAGVYDLAQRTLVALDAAQRAGLALQEKLP